MLPCNLIHLLDFCLMIFGTVLIYPVTSDSVKKHENCGDVDLDQSGCSEEWKAIYSRLDNMQAVDISDRSRFQKTEKGLHITDPKPQDSGRYTCDAGVNWKYLYVKNKQKTIDIWLSPSHTTEWRFQTVRMTCRVAGATGATKVTWRHTSESGDVTDIDMDDDQKNTQWWDTARTDGNYDLKIVRASLSDTGWYECKVGETTNKALLTIKDLTVETLSIKEGKLGDTVTLECPSGGNTADIDWMDEHFESIESTITVEKGHSKTYYCLTKGVKKPRMDSVELKQQFECSGEYKRWNKKCYKLNATMSTFMQAEKMCRADGGHLATPGRQANGSFTNKTLKEDLTHMGLAEETKAWVGMDRIGQWNKEGKPVFWRWSNGRVVEKFQDPGGDPGDCAYIDKKILKRGKCWDLHPYICEKTALDHYSELLTKNNDLCPNDWTHFFNGGFCYWQSKSSKPSQPALIECRKKGDKHDIAQPKTKREFRNVYMMTATKGGGYGRYWIGMYRWRENYFRDGTRHVETADWEFELEWAWRYHKPCLAISTESRGGYYNKLRPFHCTEMSMPYICQKRQNPPPKEYSCGRTSATLAMDTTYTIGERHNALPDSMPWSVQVYHNETDTFLCGGVLFSDTYILTSADCLHDKTTHRQIRSRYIRVFAGSEVHNFSDAVVVEPRDVYIHPEYNPSSGKPDNNIGVIVLKERLYYGVTIQPVCLPEIRDLQYSVCLYTFWNKDNYNDQEYYRLQYCVVDPTDLHEQKAEINYLSMDHRCGVEMTFSANALVCVGSNVGGRWEVVGITQAITKTKQMTVTKVFNFKKWLNEADLFTTSRHLSFQRVCLGGSFKAYCPGREVEIKSAYFERTNIEVCPDKDLTAVSPHTCHREDITGKAWTICNNKDDRQNCTFKYPGDLEEPNYCNHKPPLLVFYACERRSEDFKVAGCGNYDWYDVICGDYMIKITKSSWGGLRIPGTSNKYFLICQTEKTKACFKEINILELIDKRCNGKNRCRLKISRSTMRNEDMEIIDEHCPSNAHTLYFEAYYKCLPNVTYGGWINEFDWEDYEEVGGQQMMRPTAALVAACVAVTLAWL